MVTFTPLLLTQFNLATFGMICILSAAYAVVRERSAHRYVTDHGHGDSHDAPSHNDAGRVDLRSERSQRPSGGGAPRNPANELRSMLKTSRVKFRQSFKFREL